jgi:hypothetical protein
VSKKFTAMVPATLRIAHCCKEVILALIAAHGYFSVSRSLRTVLPGVHGQIPAFHFMEFGGTLGGLQFAHNGLGSVSANN